jgi:hypothetical protein
MKKITIESLTKWIKDLKEAAKKDESFSIAWFGDTKDEPFSIIGGWLDGFSEDYSDIFCMSKSNPSYAMCIKIAINEGPYAYTDFEIMNMPVDPVTKEVDNTCIPLEWDDDPEYAAQFFLSEWERIMKDHTEVEE